MKLQLFTLVFLSFSFFTTIAQQYIPLSGSGNSTIYQSASNLLGIGTTSPTGNLHLYQSCSGLPLLKLGGVILVVHLVAEKII